jgi:microsomal dipeptidase-like Zn-dependent dipeptidase
MFAYWFLLEKALAGRAYPDEEIAGMLGENFLGVFEQVVG